MNSTSAMNLVLAFVLCGVGLLFFTIPTNKPSILNSESEKRRWLAFSFRIIAVLILVFGGFTIYRNTAQRDVSAYDRRKVLTSVFSALSAGAALGAIVVVGLAGGFRTKPNSTATSGELEKPSPEDKR